MSIASVEQLLGMGGTPNLPAVPGRVSPEGITSHDARPQAPEKGGADAAAPAVQPEPRLVLKEHVALRIAALVKEGRIEDAKQLAARLGASRS